MPITKKQDIRTVAECVQCGEVFDSQIKLREHIRKVHINKRKEEMDLPIEDVKVDPPKPAETIKAPPPAPPVVLPPDPIILEYKYKGICPKCRNTVRTIMLDVGDYFAIAYCSNCDKKLTQTKVIPIDKQFKK